MKKVVLGAAIAGLIAALVLVVQHQLAKENYIEDPTIDSWD